MSAAGFDFGSGGGSGSTEKILIGSLAVVIVGTIACTIYFGFIGDKSPGPPPDFHMWCLKCNKEVVVTRKEIMDNPAPQQANVPPGMPPVNGMPMVRPMCPICKTNSLIHEKCCYKCGKYFVTDWDKSHPMVSPNPMEAGPPPKCPYCGTVQNNMSSMPPGSPGGPGGGPMPSGPGGPGPGGPGGTTPPPAPN